MKGMVWSLFLLGIQIAQGQEITVQSQREPDVDFRMYETFNWALQAEKQTDESAYFLNDLVLKADIRDAVHGELEDRGYHLTQTNPDLLVNFRVFEGAVEGYGRSYWIGDEFPGGNGDIQMAVPGPGTLIISLLDKKNGKLIWEGFASGLIEDNVFTRDEKKIREAVNTIFENYGYRITEYTKR
jgi:hypothetical protein